MALNYIIQQSSTNGNLDLLINDLTVSEINCANNTTIDGDIIINHSGLTGHHIQMSNPADSSSVIILEKDNVGDFNILLNNSNLVNITPESTTINTNIFKVGDFLEVDSEISLTTINGNLNVTGNINYVNELKVSDPLIEIAVGNTGIPNTVDMGFYGTYGTSGGQLYTGFYRDNIIGQYRLFDNLGTLPSDGKINANDNNNTTLRVSKLLLGNGNISIPSLSFYNNETSGLFSDGNTGISMAINTFRQTQWTQNGFKPTSNIIYNSSNGLSIGDTGNGYNIYNNSSNLIYKLHDNGNIKIPYYTSGVLSANNSGDISSMGFTSSNITNTIVSRDNNGDFSGRFITGTRYSITGESNSYLGQSNPNNLDMYVNSIQVLNMTEDQITSHKEFVINTMDTGIVHSSSTGVLSSSLIQNSDISDGTIQNSKLSTTVTKDNMANSIVLRDANGAFSSGIISTPSIINSGNLNISTTSNNPIIFKTLDDQKLKIESDGVLTSMSLNAIESTLRLISNPTNGVCNIYFNDNVSYDIGRIKYYHIYDLLEIYGPQAIKLDCSVVVLNNNVYLAKSNTLTTGYLNLINGDSTDTLNLYEGKAKINPAGVFNVMTQFTYMTTYASNPSNGTGYAIVWNTEDTTNSNIIQKFPDTLAGDKFRILKSGIYNISLHWQSTSDMYVGFNIGWVFNTALTPTNTNDFLTLAFKRKLNTLTQDQMSWTGYISSPYELTIQMNVVSGGQVNITNSESWRLRITFIH